MATVNYGICEKCKAHVEATHVIRDGKVYLKKECAECGPTEALISSDAERWQKKREICHYDADAAPTCDVHCTTCLRREAHHPKMVFLDVTNRCNMNCPICIANIPGMGFEYHPPLSYFERVFDGLAQFEPKPRVQLFGGEPTVRGDLFEIIKLARDRGLRVGIVTNGLKLADEEYCKKICESRVRVLMAFDGRSPEIYSRLRKNPSAYEKKVKALENLCKLSSRRHTIMCCVARKINDKHMRDLIDFCYEKRDHISFLHLIPLTENWEEGTFEESGVTTTTEDVEQIIDEAFPDEHVEFVPSGLTHHLSLPMSFFGKVRLTFGGVHPNCESATMLVADDDGYRPMSRYLRRPMDEIGEELVTRTEAMRERLSKLDPAKPLQRWRGRLLIARKMLPMMLRDVNLDRLARGNKWWTTIRFVFGLMTGQRFKDLFRKLTRVYGVLGMLVLPFEETHSIEGARLHNCTAGFAFEDPDDGVVKTIPVCAWGLYRDTVVRKIAEKNGIAPPTAAGD
jgi:hypothetical protein